MTVQCRKGKDDRPDECCGECGAVDPQVMPLFGDTVVVNAILVRRHKTEVRKGRMGGTFTASCKFWQEKSVPPRSGLLIGFRNLSNGTREWEAEVGYLYSPDEHFKAALVVFSEKENPVYVPISGLA